jgi:hypothetical protein
MSVQLIAAKGAQKYYWRDFGYLVPENPRLRVENAA